MARAHVASRIPPELRELMERYPEVNWSVVLKDVPAARILEAARGIVAEDDDPGIAVLAERLKRGAGARFRKSIRTTRR